MAEKLSIQDLSRQPLIVGTSRFTDPTGNYGYSNESLQVSALVRIADALEAQLPLAPRLPDLAHLDAESARLLWASDLGQVERHVQEARSGQLAPALAASILQEDAGYLVARVRQAEAALATYRTQVAAELRKLMLHAIDPGFNEEDRYVEGYVKAGQYIDQLAEALGVSTGPPAPGP